MREQWSRSRKGLEEAMVRGDAFTLDEMTNLFEHPVISKHLEKLAFISNENDIGFYEKGKNGGYPNEPMGNWDCNYA